MESEAAFFRRMGWDYSPDLSPYPRIKREVNPRKANRATKKYADKRQKKHK